MNKIIFLDTTVFKGQIRKKSNMDIKTHYKPTETFQFTHFATCHPPGVKHSFIEGQAIRLLRTSSPKEVSEECLLKFKQSFKARGYLENIIEISLSRSTLLLGNRLLRIHKSQKVTTYHSAVKNLKRISMEHWIQPLLEAIFKKPLIIFYRKGKSRSWEQKYNFKAIVRRDHKSHMGSPC